MEIQQNNYMPMGEPNWFVHDVGYPHSDGVWRVSTLHNGNYTGYYATRQEAEAQLLAIRCLDLLAEEEPVLPDLEGEWHVRSNWNS